MRIENLYALTRKVLIPWAIQAAISMKIFYLAVSLDAGKLYVLLYIAFLFVYYGK